MGLEAAIGVVKFYLVKQKFRLFFAAVMKQFAHIHHHHTLPNG